MSNDRNSQRTAFVDCIRNGDEKGVRRILSTNENLLKEKYEQYRETALHLAVRSQQKKIVKLLLQFKADIHATDCHLRTPLHTACDENDDTNIIALILKCEGVNVNAKDGYGNTSVKLAAEKGNSDAVKLLMEKGAVVTIPDDTHNTTLHVAAEKGHSEVLELLLEKLHVANKGIIGKQNKNKDTPLHLAVTSKCPQCVALLLNAGAVSTMDVQNKQGQNVTDYAKEHGNKKILSLLENPQRAKELFQAKPKSANSMSVLGRGGSVESDSYSCFELTERNLPNGLRTDATVVLVTNQVNVSQQINANISGGNNALGPGARVVNAQEATAVEPRRSVPSGDSHYNLTVNGGNAAVGDNSKINLAPGTPGTPSTTGSSDVPFFPEPQENRYASSGFPTENPSSLGATESATRPIEEESPGDKLDESSRLPVGEESPGYKFNESSRHPIQEEHPRDPSDVSTLSRPVEEECPTDKSHVPSISPVQEESPKDELNESSHHPVQEEHPRDPSDVSTLSRPVEEECPTDKSHVPSTSPVQEESPMGKSNELLPYSVPEENSARKPDGVFNSSHTEALCTSLHSIGNQTRTEDDKNGKNGNRDVALPRVRLEKSSGTSFLVRTPEEPKSAVEPSINVPKSMASPNAADAGPRNRPLGSARCSSSCAPSPSCGKESPHRKAQHSMEDMIPEGTLPAGAVANANESMRTARNGEASFPGNHHGHSTTIVLEDDNPENDRKGHEKCNGGCRLM